MNHRTNQIFISYRRDDAAGYAGRLEEALECGARVVPVLLPGATMPAAADLPAPLKPLAQRNALSLNDVHWDADIERWRRAAGQRLPPGELGTCTRVLGRTGRLSQSDRRWRFADVVADVRVLALRLRHGHPADLHAW